MFWFFFSYCSSRIILTISLWTVNLNHEYKPLINTGIKQVYFRFKICYSYYTYMCTILEKLMAAPQILILYYSCSFKEFCQSINNSCSLPTNSQSIIWYITKLSSESEGQRLRWCTVIKSTIEKLTKKNAIP